MEERHLSLGEVAQQMEVAERTVRRWIKAGKLKAYKPGRDHLIPESAIREFIESGEIRPKVERPSPEDLRDFLLEETGHTLLARPASAEATVSALASLEEAWNLHAELDLEKEAIDRKLAKDPASPSRNAQNVFKAARHDYLLVWLRKLGERRKELLAEQRHAGKTASDDVRLVAIF